MNEDMVGGSSTSTGDFVKKSAPMNSVAAIVIVALVLIGLYFMTKKDEIAGVPSSEPVVETSSELSPITASPAIEGNTATVTEGKTTPPPAPAPTPTPPPVASSNLYKNGTYTAVGSYMSPGGPEQIGITLTLKNDAIVDASAKPMADLPTSVKYQTMFAEGLKAAVMGKSIDTVKLDKVSGSSLTPKGFNDAVSKIKVQAKA